MLVKRLVKLVPLTLAIAAAPLTASAITVTITVPGTTSAGGSPLTGTFSLAPYLTLGEKVADLTLQATGYSSFGGSNEQIVITQTGAGFAPYAFVSRLNREGFYTTDTYYSEYLSQVETDVVKDELIVSSGADSGSAVVGNLGPNAGPYFEIGAFQGGSEEFGYSYYIENERIVTTGYYGSATAKTSLSTPSLAAVNATHIVPYSISAGVGEFDPSLTFTFDLTTVPEPASWTLMIVGFAGLGGYLRSARRRRRIAV